jgi:hypothetical protein
MITATTQETQPAQSTRLRSWRTAAGLVSVAAGAVIVIGTVLPWVETFAGLIGIPGLRGSNGRILAAIGIVVAAAGIYQLVRGGQATRWLAGLAGFAALGISAYLLIQLTRSLSALGGDSMVAARGGPGLWVAAAGSAAAFGTLFLPPSSQTTLRQRAAGGRGLAWAADLESAGARRGLQIALGVAWLLDAALQFQPYMFSRSFVTDVLAPASMGNPALVAGPGSLATRVIAHDVVAWNAAFATIQLALAAGLLWRRTVRAALYGTVAWGVAVWVLAEGAGGVFSRMAGMANPLTGAPGAAIIYALLALLIWPAHSRSSSESVADGGLLGRRGAQAAWLALWGSLAYLAVQPGVWSAAAMRGTFTGLASGEPHWLAAMNNAFGGAFGQHATVVSIGLATAFALAGAGILWPPVARPALILAAALAMFIWVAGEDFGGILTGHATDPNSGPLLVLLAAAFWPHRSRRTAAPHQTASAANAADPAPVARR